MKADRVFSLVFGVGLLVVGGISLVANLVLGSEAWRVWPLVVIIIGVALTLPGFLAPARRGFGSFFIPGLPVSVIGCILLYTSLTGHWEAWYQAWPIVLIALGVGMGVAAVFMRVAGLAIPAIIVGVNGIFLAFCAISGQWSAWAVLWPGEFFAVGLGLLILGLVNGSQGVKVAATVLFCLAGGGFFITSFIGMPGNSIIRFAAPALLIITGGMLTLMAFLRHNPEQSIG